MLYYKNICYTVINFWINRKNASSRNFQWNFHKFTEYGQIWNCVTVICSISVFINCIRSYTNLTILVEIAWSSKQELWRNQRCQCSIKKTFGWYDEQSSQWLGAYTLRSWILNWDLYNCKCNEVFLFLIHISCISVSTSSWSFQS
jgi:hypothetical protein